MQEKNNVQMTIFGSNQPPKRKFDSAEHKLVPNANLSNVDFSDCSPELFYELFHNVNLTGANLSAAVFKDARFFGVNLTNANLSGAVFKDARFFGVNLTGANLSGTVFEGAQFWGSTLIKSNFDDAKLNHVGFQDSDLGAATFRNAKIKNKPNSQCWVNSDFTNVDFSGASLSEGQLNLFKLDGAVFVRTRIENFWFRTGSMLKTNFREATLTKVRFSGVCADDANFSSISGKDLTYDDYDARHELSFKNANFTYANLAKVKIDKGNFTGSDFTRAKIVEVKISDTDFGSANFSRAEMSKVEISSTNFIDSDLSMEKLEELLIQSHHIQCGFFVRNNDPSGRDTADDFLRVVERQQMLSVVERQKVLEIVGLPGETHSIQDLSGHKGKVVFISKVIQQVVNILEERIQQIQTKGYFDIWTTPEGKKIWLLNHLIKDIERSHSLDEMLKIIRAQREWENDDHRCLSVETGTWGSMFRSFHTPGTMQVLYQCATVIESSLASDPKQNLDSCPVPRK